MTMVDWYLLLKIAAPFVLLPLAGAVWLASERRKQRRIGGGGHG